MAFDYQQCARDILRYLGGKDNITNVIHCMTRLRIRISDVSIVDSDSLNHIEGVQGTYIKDDEVQLIIGAGIIKKLYHVLSDVVTVSSEDRLQIPLSFSKNSLFTKLFRTFGEIFIPILPVLIASGLMSGIVQSLVDFYPAIEQYDIYNWLLLISNTAIEYLPVLVAFSTARVFGGNAYLGGTLGLILLHRDLFSAWSVSGEMTIPFWTLFGRKVYQVSYDGHIIPIIIAVSILCMIEKWFHRHMPSLVDSFVTPVLSLLITSFGMMTFFGPILMFMEQYVIKLAMIMLDLPYGIGASICAAFYPWTVVLGIHHIFIVLEVRLIADIGTNTWLRVVSSANFAMCIACLAVGMKTKFERLRSMSFPAALSAALGITEPAIFGVNFRYYTPFVCGMFGAAAGAATGTILNVYGTAYGVSALPGFLITSPCLWQYLVMLFVAGFVTFVLTWLFWNDEKNITEKEIRYADTISLYPVHDSDGKSCVYAPLHGTVIPKNQIWDETFAEGYLGDGVGIIPDKSIVTAPFNGKVLTITKTKHAMILEGPDKMQLLIHIGIDTVNLKGKGFTLYVSEGDTFKTGDKLMEIDLNYMLYIGYDLTSAVMLINHADYTAFDIMTKEYTSSEECIFKVGQRKAEV